MSAPRPVLHTSPPLPDSSSPLPHPSPPQSPSSIPPSPPVSPSRQHSQLPPGSPGWLQRFNTLLSLNSPSSPKPKPSLKLELGSNANTPRGRSNTVVFTGSPTQLSPSSLSLANPPPPTAVPHITPGVGLGISMGPKKLTKPDALKPAAPPPSASAPAVAASTAADRPKLRRSSTSRTAAAGAALPPPPHPTVAKFRSLVLKNSKLVSALLWGPWDKTARKALHACAVKVDPDIVFDPAYTAVIQREASTNAILVSGEIERLLAKRADELDAENVSILLVKAVGGKWGVRWSVKWR
ncbi:uncharacterized protein EHS24_007314 [Apiotrichum porosum]|uniref:Uncharacterized protein n=1 Tax=Apiotrichum porosum TaxID=105984 RepID=A0A427XU67_9TREE|nr:uncharacterized protein EHS24_007314 [Apiotrichum porosum]RSH82347.1 hypothetical protein EHS24_007314 [Apiotrichum porosum]